MKSEMQSAEQKHRGVSLGLFGAIAGNGMVGMKRCFYRKSCAMEKRVVESRGKVGVSRIADRAVV
jgi:hypothetical protein